MNNRYRKHAVGSLSSLLLIAVLGATPLLAGVDKQIQNIYVQQYENRAMYLKVPVHGARQVVFTGSTPRLDPASLGQPAVFRVGEQVRITDIEFKNTFVMFRLSGLASGGAGEVVFQFSAPLDDQFTNRDQFDSALGYVFTSGASYKEIDSAKENFIADQFDRLIEQFAATTGSSKQFVIQTISEKNPDFEKNRQELERVRQQLSGLEDRVSQENRRRIQAETELGDMKARLLSAEDDADSLKAERSELVEERDQLGQQVRRLEKENQSLSAQKKEYDNQLQKLVSTLDQRNTDRVELGGQVSSLNTVIDTLKADRERLQADLTARSERVVELESDLATIESNLGEVKTERDRLSRDMRALTTDKNSINSRYRDLSNANEGLEKALLMASEIRLGPPAPGDSEGKQVSDVILSTQILGRLEVVIPTAPGKSFQAALKLDSPDLVKFTETERQLWKALGEKLVVVAELVDEEGNVVGQEGDDPERSVGPRDEAVWLWNVDDTTQSWAFSLSLNDDQGRLVPVARQFFARQSSGLGDWLQVTSLGFLALGLLLGFVMAALLVKRRKPPRPMAPTGPRPVVTEKGL